MDRTVSLDIRGNIYDVEYPNTGQQIDIELLKARIADGSYEMLRLSSNPVFQHQADRIDMIATFSILIPKLKKDLNVETFFALKEEESDVLVAVYEEQFMPWYTKIKTAIRNPQDQLKKSEDNKDKLASDRD